MDAQRPPRSPGATVRTADCAGLVIVNPQQTCNQFRFSLSHSEAEGMRGLTSEGGVRVHLW